MANYDTYVNAASKKYNVDSALINGIISVESSGNPAAVSSAGAQGLMQLMPGTFDSLSNGNPFNPADNIDAGTNYISQLLKKYNGDVNQALAAYNAGSGNVSKYGWEKYSGYVNKVLSASGYSAENQTGGVTGDTFQPGGTGDTSENGLFKNILIIIIAIGVAVIGIICMVSAIGIDTKGMKEKVIKEVT